MNTGSIIPIRNSFSASCVVKVEKACTTNHPKVKIFLVFCVKCTMIMFLMLHYYISIYEATVLPVLPTGKMRRITPLNSTTKRKKHIQSSI